ncbi:MAG: DUF3990 domain-containing protein [Treponema sp.]
MILYHGSNIDIQKIDLSQCRPGKDFGQGFYLTEIKEQAVRMAQRVSRMFGGNAVLNVYDFDDSILSENKLAVKIFEKPSVDWAKFVITNRNASRIKVPQEENNIDNKFDIVIGPVADDDLALLFRQFSDGVISVETLMQEMNFKELTNQYSFHTERAVSFLTKVEVQNV